VWELGRKGVPSLQDRGLAVWGGVVALNRKKFDGIPLTYSSI